MLEFYVQLDPVKRLDVNMPRDMTYEEIANLGGAINRLSSADLDRASSTRAASPASRDHAAW